jgi:hypothetical protein
VNGQAARLLPVGIRTSIVLFRAKNMETPYLSVMFKKRNDIFDLTIDIALRIYKTADCIQL